MRRALAALLCAGSLVACGDDAATGDLPATGGPRSDAGRQRDAARPDASAHDHEIFSGDLYLCGFDDEDVRRLPGHAEHTEVAIATDDSGFGFVFQDEAGSVFIQAIDALEGAQEPVRVVPSGAAVEAAALVAGREGFLLAYRSGTRLHARSLAGGAAPAEPTALSEALSPPEGGEPFALLALQDGFVLAALETGAGGAALRLQRLGRGGEPAGEPRELPEIAALAPLDLHLATLGGGRVLLSYFARDAMGEGRVYGVPLSAELEPEREPEALSRHTVAEARYDLAARAQSAGLIYQAKDGGIRDAIKFRRIEARGSSTQAVLNVVDAPGRAVAGSIAAFGQGYAIAFRELPSLGVEKATVRIAFVDQFGHIVHEAEIAETTEQGGRTTISATADGHVLVGYTSLWPAGATTHAVKLHCPGALVLCGGALE